jgi:histidinol phosphatase-like PHP family hydrolase
MKIDLHVHAKERSGCAVSGEEEMIQTAIAYGLDGLVFTDHQRLVLPERLAELNRTCAPFRVFGGIEITLVECEDVLVLGVHDPVLEAQQWTYPALLRFVRERGGLLVLAHPFRYHHAIQIDVEQYLPDAVEIHSANTGACDESQIRAVAERLGLRLLCNSDAHSARLAGIYYNELARAPRDEQELVDILRAGEYTCHRMDERIAAFNGEVREREDLIHRMIAEGRDREYYRRTTGKWEGQFDRVAMGRSYRI